MNACFEATRGGRGAERPLDGQLTLEVLDQDLVLGNDEHVVALSLMGAVRKGRRITVKVVSVFHYRNGKQCERWFHPTDPAAWDDMFS